MNILQALYESEINFSISTFWDGGFDVKLGDAVSGYKAETNVRTAKKAIEFLSTEALKHYPDSDFAEWWDGAFEDGE